MILARTSHSNKPPVGALAASDPPLEYEQFEQGRAELAAKYNQHFHSEWIPELKEKYNLKVLGE